MNANKLDEKITCLAHTIGTVKAEIAELLSKGQIIRRGNTSKIAVFRATRLDGSLHVGWHYAPESTIAGDRFHYDHGAGINKNTDGQYLWVCPLNAEDISSVLQNADHCLAKPIKGIFRWSDGRVTVSQLSADTTYVNRPHSFYVDNSPVSSEKLASIVSISSIPSEMLDVWEDYSTRPNEGELILSWDCAELRTKHSGPYLNSGKFELSGCNNRRFQNYNGPMLGGLTWVSQKIWQSVSTIESITADLPTSNWWGR